MRPRFAFHTDKDDGVDGKFVGIGFVIPSLNCYFVSCQNIDKTDCEDFLKDTRCPQPDTKINKCDEWEKKSQLRLTLNGKQMRPSVPGDRCIHE